jgi:Ca-activated chloride channel family protein
VEDLLREARGISTVGDSVDEPLMEKIAEKTGGKYFRATDTDGLSGIYEEIDRLEKTNMESSVHVTHKECFLLALVPALGLLVTERGLAVTRFLRIP